MAVVSILNKMSLPRLRDVNGEIIQVIKPVIANAFLWNLLEAEVLKAKKQLP